MGLLNRRYSDIKRASLLLAILFLCLSLLCGCGKPKEVSGVKAEKTKFREVKKEPSNPIDWVNFIDKDNGWGWSSSTGGSNGVGLLMDHYHDGGWHTIETYGMVMVTDIVPIDSSNVWAVGTENLSHVSTKNTRGVIINITGASGTKYSWPTKDHKYSISMSSEHNGFVVGAMGDFLHYDGDQWHLLKGPGPGFWDCAAVSNQECWAVGPCIAHYKDGRWSNETITGDFESISKVNSSDVWAVGYEGVIAHWDGASWRLFDSPTKTMITSVDMIDSKTGLAVDKKGNVLQYNGESWRIVKNYSNTEFESVSAVSANEAWATSRPYKMTQSEVDYGLSVAFKIRL